MAYAYGKSLLAAVVAFVVSGAARAQDPAFQEGVKLLRLIGNTKETAANDAKLREEALQKFQAVLQKDPSHAEALQLYNSVSQDEWFLMLNEKGEIQKIAESILDRAKLEQKTRSRDQAAIDGLVTTACAKDSTYEQRRDATFKLIGDHGEFAVPALVQRLGNADDAEGQIRAIATLEQLGAAAVMPLCEATKSSNPQVRWNAAAALSHIGDDRSLPAMARLKSDDHANVKDVAERFLAKKGVAGKSATDLHLAAARQYLKAGVLPGAFSDVVWTMNGDKLEAKDVPALVYGIELAKGLAHDAVARDPLSADARSVAAQANLAEANVIESSVAQGDAKAKALEGAVPALKMAALATGTPVLRAALAEGMKSGLAPVALGAIEALGASEDRESIGNSQPLVEALDSTDKRVRYAAAMTIAKVTHGNTVPAADKVAGVLAAAVTEESMRVIHVIDPAAEASQAVREASNSRGTAAVADASARGGMRSLLDQPNVDVVVINEILPDRMPEDIIGNIKNDPRMAKAKVLIVAKDVEKAKARFGDKVADVIQGPLSGKLLLDAANKALEGVPVEASNARAEQVAKGASEALLTLATGRSNIGGALANLAGQLNRGDAVAVPAARALGIAGTGEQVDALVAAATGGGSADLKVAASEALGGVLGRMGDCPAKVFEKLNGVLHGDADVKVKTAIAVALGKAKLGDGDKAKLIDSLRTIASAKSDG